MAKWSAPAVFRSVAVRHLTLGPPLPITHLLTFSASQPHLPCLDCNPHPAMSVQSVVASAWAHPSVTQTPSTVLCPYCVTPALLAQLWLFCSFLFILKTFFFKMSNHTREGGTPLQWIKPLKSSRDPLRCPCIFYFSPPSTFSRSNTFGKCFSACCCHVNCPQFMLLDFKNFHFWNPWIGQICQVPSDITVGGFLQKNGTCWFSLLNQISSPCLTFKPSSDD